eukprot:5964795-Pyramimonas_sp.AAC.1
MKGCRPTLDVRGEPSKYWEASSDPVFVSRVSSFSCAENMLRKSGPSAGARFRSHFDSIHLRLSRLRGSLDAARVDRQRGKISVSRSAVRCGRNVA